jgi:hypothetical protein
MTDYAVTELSDDIDFDTLPYWDVVIIRVRGSTSGSRNPLRTAPAT